MKTLEITTKIGCVNACSYCPQDKLLKAYRGNRLLSYDGFKLLLNNVPKDVRIDFSGFCEPFLNGECSEMIKYSIELGYKTVLYTTFVGFSVKDIVTLKGLGFEEVVFHIFDGVGFNLNKFNQDISFFRDYVQDGRVVKLGKGEKMSRAGNVWGRSAIYGKFRCGVSDKSFDCNVVLPNGDVYLCCMDYGLKHKLGNLFETSYDDLNRSDIKAMSNTTKSNCICRKCERMVKI